MKIFLWGKVIFRRTFSGNLNELIAITFSKNLLENWIVSNNHPFVNSKCEVSFDMRNSTKPFFVTLKSFMEITVMMVMFFCEMPGGAIARFAHHCKPPKHSLQDVNLRRASVVTLLNEIINKCHPLNHNNTLPEE